MLLKFLEKLIQLGGTFLLGGTPITAIFANHTQEGEVGLSVHPSALEGKNFDRVRTAFQYDTHDDSYGLARSLLRSVLT